MTPRFDNPEDRASLGQVILNVFLSKLPYGECKLTKTAFNRDFDQIVVTFIDDPRWYFKFLIGKFPSEGGHNCDQCEKDALNCISDVEETDQNEENY